MGDKKNKDETRESILFWIGVLERLVNLSLKVMFRLAVVSLILDGNLDLVNRFLN